MASKPGWFFAAMPVPEDLARLQERIADAGIFDQLGRRMFAPENWHQTLSDRFWEPDEATRAALMRAGERLQFRPFTLGFRQVKWSRHSLNGRIYCTLVGASGADELKHCVGAVRTALSEVCLMSPQGHSPHITLSYSAADLHPNVDILPFQWTVRELLLVEGGGDPYRYSVHGRWPLSLPAAPQGQDDLFT